MLRETLSYINESAIRRHQMLKEYRFFDGLTVQFDEQKTVRELLKYAFEQGEYY